MPCSVLYGEPLTFCASPRTAYAVSICRFVSFPNGIFFKSICRERKRENEAQKGLCPNEDAFLSVRFTNRNEHFVFRFVRRSFWCWEGLLLVTDVSTIWAEVMFRRWPPQVKVLLRTSPRGAGPFKYLIIPGFSPLATFGFPFFYVIDIVFISINHKIGTANWNYTA